MQTPNYVSAFGISYAGTLPKIRKSPEQLQPVFEALTNSFEAINLSENGEVGEITIRINHSKKLFGDQGTDFVSLQIIDTGIGFTDKEFNRIENLNDNSKAFFNKGSGRVQFLHFFDKTEYDSIYADNNSASGFRRRVFTLSKNSAFLKQNAIIRIDKEEDIVATSQTTTVTFRQPLVEKDNEFYNQLTIEYLKEKIVTRYLAYLCENRERLPKIIFQFSVNGNVAETGSIQGEDIPEIDQQKDITLNYSKISPDGRSVEKTTETETLNLKAFKIQADQLAKNGLKLTSKGEIAKEIKLESLLPDDTIDNKRYLFLISGDYINKKDGDTRGKLVIPTIDEFKKGSGSSESLFSEHEILIDDIQESANEAVLTLYKEIREKQVEKEQQLEELKEMFLLNPEAIRDAKIKLTDTEERILEKVYQADAKLVAQKDAEIKQRIDALNKLNPKSIDFQDNFEKEVEELTRVIPLQNKATLVHYIARRKLVLELFDKILKKQLDIQNSGGRKFDESLVHNLLFQQGTDDPSKSDLWIVNEDFIYFRGISEARLCDVEINGTKLFKDAFSEEEEKYLTSLGENRRTKRPDILLFPEEGRCIIIEFKDPEVNAAEHLTQIDYYSYLIRNFTNDQFQITMFFGFLLGESIEPRDVRGHVGSYEHAYHFDYLFRPPQKVVGENGRSDGSIYSEVIKYSTLIARAQKRNKVFLDKL